MPNIESLIARLEQLTGAEWITLTAERALYVQHGRTVVLCDRLPSPVTLVLKLDAESLNARAALSGKAPHPSRAEERG